MKGKRVKGSAARGREAETVPETTPGAEEGPGLEERLRRLDEIVAALEGGEVELERGLALFEEGIGHIRGAEALLSRAELRVEELIGEAQALELRELEERDG